MTRRVAHAAQIGALVLALALVPAAVAAKGGSGGGKPSGGSGSSSLSLADPLVHDANGNGLPNRSDVVTFTVSTTAGQPYVNEVLPERRLGPQHLERLLRWSFPATAGTSGSASSAWQGWSRRLHGISRQGHEQGWTQLASTSFRVDA